MALWTLTTISSRLVRKTCRKVPNIPQGRQQVSYMYSQAEGLFMTRFFMMFRLVIFFPAAAMCHAPTEAKKNSQALSFDTARQDGASSMNSVWPLSYGSGTLGYQYPDPPPIFWTPPKTIMIAVSLGGDGSDISAEALVQPLIEEAAWNTQSGSEFQRRPDLAKKLALMGQRVAVNDGSNEWIKWKIYKDEPEGISVWTGRALKEGCYGSQLPLIKSRSVIPLSCKDMVDLMMDSSKVPIYNTWSLGRTDCWVLDDHTKIVQNVVKPPIGSKQLVSTTLLHACPLDDDAWVIVSRAVRGFPEPKDAFRTEILLGVNLVEPIGDNACRLTSVNHVYTSGVPTILAESFGVKSAIKFVNDLRRLREEGKI